MLHREVQEFFASAQSDGYCDIRSDYEQSVDGGHGRIEVRRVRVSDDIGWMSEGWPTLECQGGPEVSARRNQHLHGVTRYWFRGP